LAGQDFNFSRTLSNTEMYQKPSELHLWNRAPLPSGADISSFFKVLKSGGFLLPCYAEPLLNLTVAELTRCAK